MSRPPGRDIELTKFESDVRAGLMKARSIPERAQAESALTQALGQFFAVAEAYPQLKADANFRQLQTQLAEIEDQLQMARRYYNGTVRNLNILVQSFPDTLIAHLGGFRPEPFFELENRAEGAAPTVSFAAGRTTTCVARSCRIRCGWDKD